MKSRTANPAIVHAAVPGRLATDGWWLDPYPLPRIAAPADVKPGPGPDTNALLPRFNEGQPLP